MMYLCTGCGYAYNNFTYCPHCGEYDFELIHDIDEELDEDDYVPISAQDAEIEDFENTFGGADYGDAV